MTGEELIGKRVRLTEAYKASFSKNPYGREFVEEFFDSVGIVEGLLDYGEFKGPEVDVRWTEGFRYGYHPDDLEIVD